MRRFRVIAPQPKELPIYEWQKGCDYRCSFCIIPHLRGKQRSRPIESIVTESEQLAAQGVQELILISQITTQLRFRSLRRSRSWPNYYGHWVRLISLGSVFTMLTLLA